MTDDPRIAALPDIHGHAKGEHKPFAEERPIPYTARMLFLWFFHACRRGAPRFVMVADHMNYLTFEDPAAVNLVRRALKLAQAGDLYGAAETAGVELGHAAAVSDGLRKGMRYSIGAEIDNDPRCRPDAQNIVDAMRPDGMIRSIHFLPIAHPQHGENWMWAFDNPEFKELYDVVGTERVWQIYMATLLEAIEKLPGHIVGHFYVPAKFGHWPDDATLERYEDQLLDACAERGLAVEVNSRYFYKHYAGDDEQLARYRDVHLRLLRKASRKGVPIAVGSDAHSPKDQGAAFDAVLALLDEAKINEIAFPINGRLARVALRATEEIRRRHAAALSASPAAPVAATRDEAPDEPHEQPSAVAGVPARDDAASGASGEPHSATRALPRRTKVRSEATPIAGDRPPEFGGATGRDAAADDAAASSIDVYAEGSHVAASDAEFSGAPPRDAARIDDVAAETAAPPAARKLPARKRRSRAALAAVDSPSTVAAGAGDSPETPSAKPVPDVPVALATPAERAPGKAKLVPKPRVTPKMPARPASVAAQTGRAAPATKTAANRVRVKKTVAKKVAAKAGGSKRPAANKPASRKASAASTSRLVKKAAPHKAPATKKAAAAPAKRVPAMKHTALKRSAPKHAAVKKSGGKKKVKPRR